MARALQSYKRLFDTLKKGKLSRVYFLYGPEEYLKKEFIGELIRTALSERNRAFNLDIFHGDEFEGVAFDDRMSAFPLFSENRIVILRKFDELSTSRKDFVLKRIQDIPPSLIFVAETREDKLDNARMKALKEIAEDQGTAFRFSYLSEEETIERIRGRLKREGFDIDQDALELLVESVGTQLIDLANEVEKIVLCSAGEPVISRELVKQVVGRYRTESIFSLLDSLAGGDSLSLMIDRVDKLIDGGEEPVFILAMMLKRVAQLLEVKLVLDEQRGRVGTPQALFKRMDGLMSPFQARILLHQSACFEKDEVELLLNNLRWADLTLKTSQINPKHILEEALMASFARKKLATFMDIL